MPRNVAIAILVVLVIVVFLAVGLLIPWSGPAAPAAAAPDTAAATPGTVDLLKLVDPAQDVVRGMWTREGDALKCTQVQAQSQVEFPYAPAVEYDFSITFQDAQGPIAFVCAAGGKQFVWRMSPGGLAGFALVGGQTFTNNGSSQQNFPWHADGTAETVTFKFRRDHVDIIADNKPAITFPTDYSDFSLNNMYSQHRPDTLGFFAGSTVTIQSAKVTEISGQGTRIR